MYSRTVKRPHVGFQARPPSLCGVIRPLNCKFVVASTWFCAERRRSPAAVTRYSDTLSGVGFSFQLHSFLVAHTAPFVPGSYFELSSNMSYNDSRDSVLNKPKPVVHLDSALLDRITKSVQPYPIAEGRKYEYGTAGVRCQPLL
jgi:hypothetical protein